MSLEEDEDQEVRDDEYYFCQAGDGIRGAQESRGLGNVYRRQQHIRRFRRFLANARAEFVLLPSRHETSPSLNMRPSALFLSLLHT